MLKLRSAFSSSSVKIQSGQALLVIVLVMVVVITIGLSLASRSIVNTRTTAEEESSQKAFAAAEAGIERLLQTETQSISNQDIGGAVVTASRVTGSTRTFVLNLSNQVNKDEGVDLWMSPYPDYNTKWPSDGTQGQFHVFWGGNGSFTCSPVNAPAVEIVVLSGDINTPAVSTYVYDPCATRINANNFDAASSVSTTIDGVTFQYRTPLPLRVTRGMVARIIPLYTNAQLAVQVTSGPDLPSQGKNVVSTGTSGGAARRIQVFQSHPRLPTELFNYAIFAP